VGLVAEDSDRHDQGLVVGRDSLSNELAALAVGESEIGQQPRRLVLAQGVPALGHAPHGVDEQKRRVSRHDLGQTGAGLRVIFDQENGVPHLPLHPEPV